LLNNPPNDNKDNLRAAYAAVAAYHNSLVEMRFTIAGLFLAANGFLAIGFFQPSISIWYRVFMSLLGMVLAIICWLLEVRTYQLLENLDERGGDLEKGFSLHDDQGFFSLIKFQPLGPKWLPTSHSITNRFVRALTSHRVAFSLLYIIVSAFWLVMFILSVLPKSWI
jgi:hypothetical protein